MTKYDPAEQKELYEWRKSRGICTRCGSAPKFGKYTRCAACIEKAANACAAHYAANAEALRAKMRARYARFKTEGRCVDCGKPNPQAGENIRCQRCAQKRRIQNRERYVRRVKPDGICRQCDQPVKPGYKLCPTHYAIAAENMAKARAAVGKDHPWRGKRGD